MSSKGMHGAIASAIDIRTLPEHIRTIIVNQHWGGTKADWIHEWIHHSNYQESLDDFVVNKIEILLKLEENTFTDVNKLMAEFSGWSGNFDPEQLKYGMQTEAKKIQKELERYAEEYRPTEESTQCTSTP